MKTPKMNQTERAVFAALYAEAFSRQPNSTDNTASEVALDEALWHLHCYKQALKEREEE